MTDSATAKRTARRVARTNGRQLDKWAIEAGRPTAQCACGGYAFVMREGGSFVYGTGRLPVPAARFITLPCRRSCLPGCEHAATDR